MERKTTITIGETDYQAELARVESTHLGFEDHGILSVNVAFEGIGGGWGQGTGHYFADRPNRMFPWVRALIVLFGVRWEDIQGKECFILREDCSGPIVGLASKSDNDYVLFETIREEVNQGEEQSVGR